MSGIVLPLAVFGAMAVEARLAARHERALRAVGAVEPSDDVYGLMRLAYPGGFVAMMAEGWARGNSAGAAMTLGILIFIVAKAVKYWAIAALGERWTFRVLVPPGAQSSVRGPYRFLRHPNYVAVLGEFTGVMLMAHAWCTGPVATALFAWLLWLRIRVEERALGIESRG